MLKSHVKFHSDSGKRRVLVVDDELINREILGGILESDYDVLFAADGAEAMEKIREYRETLSLVLLDLMMPGIPGLELLRRMKEEPSLQQIPVIVTTSDQTSEVESLRLGAIDFIPKPYPQVGVILARVLRTIELSEDRQIISSTERDSLTGLYNKEFFFRYAEQFDQRRKDAEMDAIVLDVNHFHMLNERYGRTYADDVLRRIGQKVLDVAEEAGGIVCRREADTFLIYCPHREDYRRILDSVSVGLAGDESAANRVRLRMGVYSSVDKNIDIERRFDRAKNAADTVRNSFARTIAIYDDTLHRAELYAEQLIEDFHAAVRERQFTVFFQPKFDVRPEIPVLSGAEALVRWRHPTLGMISPGVFIPLFEDNGLIQELDIYVWREAAAQIRKWKDRFDFSVPVSVNVSRIDMYDPNLLDTFRKILEENGLDACDLHLEITESAYTQDSEQIIQRVNDLRNMGFQIEMDDFGTGYSSLNMISTLPIDALKLDMQFIRNAFHEGKDTRMLEVIIDIADYLSVPVIAEGVETEEQLHALKAMGCDMVQGYYFSKPVPAEEYEQFVIERKRQSVLPEKIREEAAEAQRDIAFGRIAYALSSGFESVYYVDTLSGHYVEFGSEGKYEDLQIERSGTDFFGDTQRNLRRVVFPEDQTRVSLSLGKEALLSQLVGSQPFSMTYRLMIDGEPVYYSLKAVRANTHDEHHIVIGVSNVDAQVRQAAVPEHANTLDFASLARALSSDMEGIYYVDTDTDTYMEFVTAGAYETLKLELTGAEFFRECQRNIQLVVYEEDRQKVEAAMEKKRLLAVLEERRTFSMDYRLVIGGEPMYYRMKVIPAEAGDSRHIIIGVTNIDAQITEDQRLEAERQSAATYARIAQALARDYFSIYYVDTNTDRFIEYSAHDDYTVLGIEKSGSDFFELSRQNMQRVAYPEDLPRFLEEFTKDNVLRELEENGSFTITYRLIFSGVPTYVHMKATRMGDNHIVIGVSNVDAQIRREQEYTQALHTARELANRDALTGVKSKHAFTEAEALWNARLTHDGGEPFGVVVCDVNGLKEVNDTQGHKAGDQYIRSASMIICSTFKHSPVFRIGGDEFVAILSGQDYENRTELFSGFAEANRARVLTGGVIIASGIACLEAGDSRFEDVFERADTAMYENKKSLKEARN